jgi:phospholipid/cholesterol/gamma-HCH transport system substrate-binding protein
MAREAKRRRAGALGIRSKGDAMETKAHHLLIGIVVVVTLVGGAVLAIWLAGISFEEKLPYRVYSEDPVAALASDAAVRMNGIEIGSVNEIKLDPANPHTVLITIQVRADVPVTEGATATLESVGFVGPSFVGITPGPVEAPLLSHDAPQPPIIPYERSALNRIMEAAPEILDQVTQITASVEAVSAEVARHHEQIGTLVTDAASTVSSLDRAAEEAPGLVSDASSTVQRVNDLIAQVDEALGERLEPMMADAEKTVSALSGAAGEAEKLIADTRRPIDRFATQGLGELRQLLVETRRMVDNLTSLIAQLERHPSSILFGAPEPTFRPEAR